MLNHRSSLDVLSAPPLEVLWSIIVVKVQIEHSCSQSPGQVGWCCSSSLIHHSASFGNNVHPQMAQNRADRQSKGFPLPSYPISPETVPGVGARSTLGTSSSSACWPTSPLPWTAYFTLPAPGETADRHILRDWLARYEIWKVHLSLLPRQFSGPHVINTDDKAKEKKKKRYRAQPCQWNKGTMPQTSLCCNFHAHTSAAGVCLSGDVWLSHTKDF